MRTYDRTNQGSTALLAARLTEAAALRSRGAPRSASAYVRDVATHGPAAAGLAAERALSSALDLLWRRGWLPEDVVAATPKALSSLVVDAVAHQTATYRKLHPRWRTQLSDLGATVWWNGVHLPSWAARCHLSLPDALTRVVELLAELMALPQLPAVAPPPEGSFVDEAGGGVDERVLTKVRGLLAKAESTPFAEEAEALSAKAQQLMARHAFEQALVDGGEHRRQEAAAIRLWLEAPYQAPKAHLVDAVASANRCRAVFYPKLGCVVLVGHETDLEIVSVLARSLHVQAARAMRAEPSRARAFRHAFLVAFAQRVRQRLTTATETPGDTRLVPVLARRQEAVTARFDTMYPGIRVRRTEVSDAAGWGAGTAAADLADLTSGRTRVEGEPALV